LPKIEAVETIPLRVPLDRLYQGSYYRMRNRCTIITRIRTSEGVIGEAYNADTDDEQDKVLAIIRDEITPRIVGLDAQRIERVWEAMLPVTLDQLRDRALPMQAIACVDSALWDAFGKQAGLPLWRLWGGYRDRVPMIGIGGYYGLSDADLERELLFFRQEHGMVGMKFKIGARPPAEDASRLRLARQIAGEDFIFVVDANQGYTLPEALDFIAKISDDVQLRWFEEPTRWHSDWRGLRDFRLRSNVNVAAGQSEISRVGMREMFVGGALDVCNFDASWGGGPTEWRRVAAMALAFDIELGHHEESQLSSHLLASVPNGTYVETFSPERDPIFWNLIANRPDLEHGQFPLPETPGFGWQLDDQFIARYRVD
jgi:D-galactarolactone cycloisomerase